VVEQKI